MTDAVVEALQSEFEHNKVPMDVRDRIRDAINGCLNLFDRSWLTPPELASELGVSPDKILYWINSGELRAVNVTKARSGRPRYRIDRPAIEEFKKLRANPSPAPKIRRKKFQPPADVIEFF
jgi:excisionase family DNA binding protein